MEQLAWEAFCDTYCAHIRAGVDSLVAQRDALESALLARRPEAPAPTERTFTVDEIRKAGKQTGFSFAVEEIVAVLYPPPKPKTPEERVTAILRRHLSSNTNAYHDAIAAEIVAELKEQP
jgi:hypothetical protein